MPSVIPKDGSPGEEEFATHCAIYKIEVKREYEFWVGRKWRCDFIIPDARIAVEIEGGIHSGGRHVRGSGAEKDMEKYNHLALAGFRLFRFSTQMVHNGIAIDTIRKALS